MIYVKKQLAALVLGDHPAADHRDLRLPVLQGVRGIHLRRDGGAAGPRADARYRDDERNGAQRWFQFAGFQFTPSEFAKLALVLMLAAVLSELRSREPLLPDVLRVCIVSR